MKHVRCTRMIAGILLAAFSVILPAQQAAQAPRDSSQLAEPDEKRANEVQPPELVMDILGIRPGLIIGEVGAGHGRLTVHLAARRSGFAGIPRSPERPRSMAGLSGLDQNRGGPDIA